MAYTAPNGGSIQFKKAGELYSAPAGSAIPFSLVPGSRIGGGSIFSAASGAIVAQSIGISTGTALNLTHPFRTLQINTGSTNAFRSPNMSITEVVGSSVTLQSNAAFAATANESCASTVSIQLIIPSPAVATILSGSDFSPSRAYLVALQPRIATASTLSAIAAFNYPMRGVVQAGSKTKFIPGAQIASRGIVISGSALSFYTNAMFEATVTIPGESSVTASPQAVFASRIAEVTGSSVDARSFGPYTARASIETNSVFAGVSAYEYAAPPPPLDGDFIELSVVLRSKPVSVWTERNAV